jgi:hypothetical protein
VAPSSSAGSAGGDVNLAPPAPADSTKKDH